MDARAARLHLVDGSLVSQPSVVEVVKGFLKPFFLETPQPSPRLFSKTPALNSNAERLSLDLECARDSNDIQAILVWAVSILASNSAFVLAFQEFLLLTRCMQHRDLFMTLIETKIVRCGFARTTENKRAITAELKNIYSHIDPALQNNEFVSALARIQDKKYIPKQQGHHLFYAAMAQDKATTSLHRSVLINMAKIMLSAYKNDVHDIIYLFLTTYLPPCRTTRQEFFKLVLNSYKFSSSILHEGQLYFINHIWLDLTGEQQAQFFKYISDLLQVTCDFPLEIVFAQFTSSQQLQLLKIIDNIITPSDKALTYKRFREKFLSKVDVSYLTKELCDEVNKILALPSDHVDGLLRDSLSVNFITKLPTIKLEALMNRCFLMLVNLDESSDGVYHLRDEHRTVLAIGFIKSILLLPVKRLALLELIGRKISSPNREISKNAGETCAQALVMLDDIEEKRFVFEMIKQSFHHCCLELSAWIAKIDLSFMTQDDLESFAYVMIDELLTTPLSLGFLQAFSRIMNLITDCQVRVNLIAHLKTEGWEFNVSRCNVVVMIGEHLPMADLSLAIDMLMTHYILISNSNSQAREMCIYALRPHITSMTNFQILRLLAAKFDMQTPTEQDLICHQFYLNLHECLTARVKLLIPPTEHSYIKLLPRELVTSIIEYVAPPHTSSLRL